MYAFASYLNGITQKIGRQLYGKSYPGVSISALGNTLYIYDGTAPSDAIALQFQDLIGQPTWISAAQVSFKTVLRSDITIGANVKFPKASRRPMP
jgi:hypothetical protein